MRRRSQSRKNGRLNKKILSFKLWAYFCVKMVCHVNHPSEMGWFDQQSIWGGFIFGLGPAGYPFQRANLTGLHVLNFLQKNFMAIIRSYNIVRRFNTQAISDNFLAIDKVNISCILQPLAKSPLQKHRTFRHTFGIWITLDRATAPNLVLLILIFFFIMIFMLLRIL